VLHPFSPEPPHETAIPSSLTRCPHHLSALCALLSPNQLSVSHLDSKSSSGHMQTPARPTLLSLFRATPHFPQASPTNPTPLNMHKRLPTGRLPSNSCIGRAPPAPGLPALLLWGASDTALAFRGCIGFPPMSETAILSKLLSWRWNPLTNLAKGSLFPCRLGRWLR
jgi:hypothetical protein